jgi:hypothetical protein
MSTRGRDLPSFFGCFVLHKQNDCGQKVPQQGALKHKCKSFSATFGRELVKMMNVGRAILCRALLPSGWRASISA